MPTTFLRVGKGVRESHGSVGVANSEAKSQRPRANGCFLLVVGVVKKFRFLSTLTFPLGLSAEISQTIVISGKVFEGRFHADDLPEGWKGARESHENVGAASTEAKS